jgi:hypothetical protein
MTMIKRATLVAALLLVACSNTVPRDLTTGSKKIAVISLAGQNFNSLENVRPSSEALVKRWMELEAELPIRGYGWSDLYDQTETRKWTHDISDWGMDPFIVQSVTKNLEPAYQIVPFAQKPVALDFDGDGGMFAYEGEHYAAKIADIIRAQPGYASGQNVDAYVVVLPGGWLLMGRERLSFGLGFFRTFFAYEKETPKGQGTYVLHAFYYVMVLDGHSLKMIGGDAARDEDDSHGLLKGHPGAYVGPEYWAQSFDAIKPEQRAKIIATLKAYIGDSMRPTLQKVGLLP